MPQNSLGTPNFGLLELIFTECIQDAHMNSACKKVAEVTDGDWLPSWKCWPRGRSTTHLSLLLFYGNSDQWKREKIHVVMYKCIIYLPHPLISALSTQTSSPPPANNNNTIIKYMKNCIWPVYITRPRYSNKFAVLICYLFLKSKQRLATELWPFFSLFFF